MLVWLTGYLSGARCRLLANGPADASQNPIISCLIQILTGFTFLVPAYPGLPGKEAVMVPAYPGLPGKEAVKRVYGSSSTSSSSGADN